jgi:PAS domain S-box-containing protein
MRSAVILSLTILLMLSASSSAKTAGDIRFDRLSVEDGLPHASVYDILQDRQGFMWFATDDGVARYDGYTFDTFKPIPDNPQSISPGGAYTLYEDRSGNIWISIRNGGINKYDPVTGMFTRYQHDPANPNSLSHNISAYDSIYEDSAGIFWFGTLNGLNRFDPLTQTFRRFYHDAKNPNSLCKGSIRTIKPDPADDKILWIGTDGGLNRFDRISRRFVRYQHDENNSDSISHDTIWNIYGELSKDGKSVLWLCTAGGLDRFDTASGKFTHFRHDPNNPDSLSQNNVYSIIPVGDGTFWVGTHGGGLNRFDPAQKTFVSYQAAKTPQSISSNIIHPLYYDRRGTLWIGTWGGGVSRIDPGNQKTRLYDENSGLSHSAVLSIYEDRSGILWIGTWSGGLNRFDPKTGIFEHFRHDPKNPDSLGNDVVGCLYEDSQGVLWIGTWGGGLNIFDRETKRFTRYVNQPDNPESLSNNAVRGICEDDAGNLWIGTTSGGINRFDRASKKFIRYLYDADKPGSVSTNNIWAAFKDSSGTLWFTSTAGLNRFDPAKDRFIQYHHDEKDPFSISSDGVINVFEDSQKRLWITTQFGLNQFDRSTGRFIRYFAEHGLPENRIESISQDNDGNLWLGTGKGLCRFNPETKKITTYGLGDGMQGNLFFYPAALKSRSGELWFGGPKGLNVIDPKKISDNPNKPAVVLTDFQIDGKSVQVRDNSVLKQSISFVREIILTPDISKFSFEFSALNYTVSAKNRYAYKMEGFDTDWTYIASDKRFAHYTNLDPGQYVFRVKGSNNDGVWNEEGASVKIIILPPWWKTLWFRVFLMVLFTALLFGGYRLRVRHIRARSRELEIQVLQRTSELRESQRKIRTLLSNLPGMAYRCKNDKEWTMEFISDGCYDMTGYQPEEFINNTNISFNALIHSEDRERVRDEVRTALQQHRPFYLIYRITDKNGQQKWMWEQGQGIFDEHGNLSALEGLISDITERKKAEESLQESEQRFSDIISFLPDATFVIDRDGKVIAWNKAIEMMSGVKAEDMLGKGDYEYAIPFYGERRPILIDLAIQASSDIEKTYIHIKRYGDNMTAENYYPNLRGKATWLFGNACILRDSHGQIAGAIESIRDITDSKYAEAALKKAKEAAEAANLAKSAFLANMSHELRTPLNAVLGYAQFLQKDPAATEHQKERLNIIHKSGEHLLSLINDILDLSKIEAGRIEISAEEFSLPDFLNNIEAMFQIRAIQKGIEFHYDASPRLPKYLRGDEIRIRQILINLLGNAVKFTEKGIVRLEADYRDGRICFEVRDTGTGIEMNELEKIFDPFHQTGSYLKKNEGTGLGLSISKRLTELMGGSLTVHSRAGEGSVFRVEIELPAFGSAQELPEAENSGVITGYKGARRKILIADDMSDNRFLLADLLIPLGFEISEAGNGEMAAEQAEKLQPDLILMDMFMPGTDGFAAVKIIRQLESKNTLTHHTPIIAVSAGAFEEHILKSREAGCDDFISKPVALGQLLAKIGQHLGLEWIHGATQTPAEAAVRIISPCPEDLEVLALSAKMGDVQAIRNKAEELMLNDKQLAPFAEELIQLVKEFQMSKIRAFLKSYEK